MLVAKLLLRYKEKNKSLNGKRLLLYTDEATIKSKVFGYQQIQKNIQILLNCMEQKYLL